MKIEVEIPDGKTCSFPNKELCQFISYNYLGFSVIAECKLLKEVWTVKDLRQDSNTFLKHPDCFATKST